MQNLDLDKSGIILDHGTISGALRAIGKLPIESFNEFEIDICCLKLLVETIISFETIYLADVHSYESDSFNTSIEILKSLNIPVDVVKIDKFTDVDIELIAINNFNGWGSRDESISTIMDLLNITKAKGHIAEGGSQYSGKYFYWMNTRLSSKIPLNYIRKLQSESNLDVNDFKLTRYFDDASFKKIVLGVAWLGYRTSLYNLVACLSGVSYSPHPLRSRIAVYDTLRPNAKVKGPTIKSIVNYLANGVVDKILKQQAEIVGAEESEFDMSDLFTVVQNMAENSTDIIDCALYVRNLPEAGALRKRTLELKEDKKNLENFRISLNTLKRELSDWLQVQPSPSEISTSFSFFSTNIKLNLPLILHKPFYPHAKYKSFLRDILGEMRYVDSLSSIHDKLYLPIKSQYRELAYPEEKKPKELRGHLFKRKFGYISVDEWLYGPTKHSSGRKKKAPLSFALEGKMKIYKGRVYIDGRKSVASHFIDVEKDSSGRTEFYFKRIVHNLDDNKKFPIPK